LAVGPKYPTRDEQVRHTQSIRTPDSSCNRTPHRSVDTSSSSLISYSSYSYYCLDLAMSDREADAERGEAPRQAQPGSARPSRSTRSRAEAAANERTPLLRISPPSDPRRLPSSPSPSDPQPPRPTSKSQSRPKFARSRSTPRRGRRRAPPVHLFPAVFLLILCALGGIVAWDLTIGECRVQWICTLLGGREAYERVWERDTGAYAPWRSLGRSGVPRGCVVDQVSVVS
jgi:hypothetical protein